MSTTSPTRGGVLAAACLAALAGAPFAAHAQVYKCPQANGSIGYQATPCATHERPAAHPTAAQLNAQQAAKPHDDKPYDDPYAAPVSSRPHPALPAAQALPSPGGAPSARESAQTSSLVADVQARNHRDSQQQAYQDAHKNDKRVDTAACNSARHNLGVLNEQRPVYSYDNKGNRVYVEDKDRAATVASMQQAVASNCP